MSEEERIVCPGVKEEDTEEKPAVTEKRTTVDIKDPRLGRLIDIQG